MIAIPILSRKKIGIRNESMVNDNTTSDRITASSTYTGTSLSDRSRISVTTADIPLRKHCSLEMARICSTASIVSSADIVVSYMINISVPSSLRNTFCIFFRQHICRNTDICYAVIPEHCLDTIHIFDFCLQGTDLFIRHAINHKG